MVTGLKNLGSKQKAAWESILAYISEHGNDATFTLGDVHGGRPTLDALVSRGLLNVKRSYENGFYYTHYSVNPRYIPATPAPEPAPAAAPAQPLSEQITDSMRDVWERHFELVDGGEPALGANMIDRERAKFGNHPMFNQIGDEVRTEWNARHNLDTPEPATVNNAPVYHTVLLPDTFVAFQAREDIEIVRHNSKKDEDGTLIHVDYRVKADAQPAPVEPEYLLGDNVTPTTGEWAGRLCWICDIRHTGVTPMYLIRDKHGKWDTWFGAEELTMVDDPANYQKNAPTSPTYDSLKALADKQDEYIQDLENALRSALVNGKTYLREVDRLGARIAELETELAEESADLEATAIRETQLAKRITELETENTELKARLAENHIQTAEERAADWGKWNKGS